MEWLHAVRTIGSDYEHHRVLSGALKPNAISIEALSDLVRSGGANAIGLREGFVSDRSHESSIAAMHSCARRSSKRPGRLVLNTNEVACKKRFEKADF